jgi:hypothetical protein
VLCVPGDHRCSRDKAGRHEALLPIKRKEKILIRFRGAFEGQISWSEAIFVDAIDVGASGRRRKID